MLGLSASWSYSLSGTREQGHSQHGCRVGEQKQVASIAIHIRLGTCARLQSNVLVDTFLQMRAVSPN